MKHRVIPSSGETLPVIGLGTYQAFASIRDKTEQDRLTEVLRLFAQQGGRFIDTSPMYSQAESVLGTLLPNVTSRSNKAWFLATKVWTDGQEAGREQMVRSAQKMGVPKLDLIQIHNLRDWRLHLASLKEMKALGTIRYIGATTWGGLEHQELEKVMREGSLDFIQISYNLGQREVEKRILPLAQDLRIAVIANRPFAQGQLFRQVKGKALPPWVNSELQCQTWAQVFLKFALSDPRVTVVIPATSKPKHLLDNMGAGRGSWPDLQQRKRMLTLL